MKSRGVARWVSEVGIIAAIYAALTIVLAPISFGPIQCRIAEALTILPFFTTAAVPGLFIGCLIANAVAGGIGILDIVAGSLATLAAAAITTKIKVKWLVPLPSVLVNAFVVGYVLYILNVMAGAPYLAIVGLVGLGQAVACYGLGMPFLYLLTKYKNRIFTRLPR
jgi:uncharacterized membrane protein